MSQIRHRNKICRDFRTNNIGASPRWISPTPPFELASKSEKALPANNLRLRMLDYEAQAPWAIDPTVDLFDIDI